MTDAPQPISLNSHTALLLIDNQQAFTHPTYFGRTRSNPQYEANSTALLSAFREVDGPGPLIVHIKHKNPSESSSPFNPEREYIRGPSYESYRNFLSWARPKPGEHVIEKSVHSAFIGTELEQTLKDAEITTLIIQGLTTDHCVSTTTRMAEDLHVCDRGGSKGRIILAGDATATFEKGDIDAETVQKVNLQSLNGEFAEVLDTRTILELIADSRAKI